jgi:hypothetical protein
MGGSWSTGQHLFRILQGQIILYRFRRDEREPVVEHEVVRSDLGRQGNIDGALRHFLAIVDRLDRVTITPVYELVIVHQTNLYVIS